MRILGFLYKHARWIATIQVVAVVLLAICSVWFGAWYPDAHKYLVQEWVLSGESESYRPEFWGVAKENISFKTPVGLGMLSLLLTFFGGVGSVAGAFRLSELEKREEEFKREQESHAETQQYYYNALHDHLVGLFAEKLPCFDDSCRASVYRLDEDTKVLRMIFRHAHQDRYKSKGRVVLPANEGFAGAVLLGSNYLHVDFKEKHGSPKYCKEVNRFLEGHGTTMPETVLQRLRMKSKCYFGFAIRDVYSKEKIAILILESLDAGKFNCDNILRIFEDHINQMAKYVSHMAHLDAQLNPFEEPK